MFSRLIVLDGQMTDWFVEQADDGFFSRLEVDPKTTYLGVSSQEWCQLLSRCREYQREPVRFVGGAGANTARWFALLEGDVQVYGQVGQDEDGDLVLSTLKEDGCQVAVQTVEGTTGRCLVFVRPNGHRVMRSDVGVGMEYHQSEPLLHAIRSGALLHLTGYLLDSQFGIQECTRAAMEMAVRENVPISVDIGSGAYLGSEVIRPIVENYASILFLNEEEAHDLLLGAPEQAAQTLLGWARPGSVVVVTQGENGVLVCQGDRIIHTPALRVPVRDTTGAGDAFVAGFLFSLMRAEPLRSCARRGCKIAAKTIRGLGGVPSRG